MNAVVEAFFFYFHWSICLFTQHLPLNCTQNSRFYNFPLSQSLYFVPPIFSHCHFSEWIRNEKNKEKLMIAIKRSRRETEREKKKFAVGILSSFKKRWEIRKGMWKYFLLLLLFHHYQHGKRKEEEEEKKRVKIIIMNIIRNDITNLIIAFFIEMISFSMSLGKSFTPQITLKKISTFFFLRLLSINIAARPCKWRGCQRW